MAHIRVGGKGLNVGPYIPGLKNIRGILHFYGGEQSIEHLYQLVSLLICHAGKPSFDGGIHKLRRLRHFLNRQEIWTFHFPGVGVMLHDADTLAADDDEGFFVLQQHSDHRGLWNVGLNSGDDGPIAGVADHVFCKAGAVVVIDRQYPFAHGRGAPGSGKGTQSAKLIDRYGLYHISTGELLRDHIKRDTELGRIANEYISKGQLIPDDLMIRILDDTLEREAKGKAGVVFDGFPRTIPQAEALKELLRKRGTDLHAVVGLEVPEDELVQRMIQRGKDTGRADDNPDTIKNRLKVYHDQTHPLREYYNKENKYIAINGTGIVDEIFNEIARGLEDKAGIKPRP